MPRGTNLTTELKEQARTMRQAGATIDSISAELGVSYGAVYNATRDIPKPVAKASVAKKEASKRAGEGNNSLRITGKVPPAEATIRAINEADRAEAETRRARAELAYEVAVAEIEDRKQQRRKVFDLEVKAREAEIKEAETRAKLVTSPSPELTLQLEQARSETARLERELSEQRHQQGMVELQRGFQGQIEVLSKQIVSANRTGLTAYDLMSQSINKIEGLAMTAGSKVDSFMRGNRSEKQLGMALSLGLSPGEYDILLRGPEIPLTLQQFQAYRSGDSQAPPTEADTEAFQRHLASAEQRNRSYEVVMAKVTQRLHQADAAVVRTDRRGKAVPNEPITVKPGIKGVDWEEVACPGCGSSVEVDLSSEQFAGARAAKARGESVGVSGFCPQCNGKIDLSGLFKSEKSKEIIKYE